MPRAAGLFLLSTIVWAAGASAATATATGPGDMVAPCRLAFLDTFEDGGTIGGELRDAANHFLRFCLDGRMTTMDLASATAAAGDSVGELRRFYVGAPHPSNPLARALEIGGDEERQLLRLLRSFIDAVLPAAEQEGLFGEFGKARTFIEQEAILSNRRLSAEQGLALRLNRLIAAREALHRERGGTPARSGS